MQESLDLQAYNYRSVKSLLEHGLENSESSEKKKRSSPSMITSGGKATTGRRAMIEAVIEKLIVMKLHGMAEGLREQLEHPPIVIWV